MSDIKKLTRINVNGEECDVDLTTVGHITSPNGTDFTLKVDNYGNLIAVDETNLPPEYDPEAQTAKLSIQKFYINSFYCGGKDNNVNEHTLNYCSHNFVELSNLTNSDINLKNITLQYSISSNEWQVLPLEGVIKAGSTFLIRGAQCSMIDSPTTKIVVDDFDMEWYITDKATGKKELIKFDSDQAKFYLAINLSAYPGTNPYDTQTTGVSSDAVGYIDLVGVNADGYEANPYTAAGGLKNSRLFKKYYSMDPVKQATKAIDARDNSKDWNFVDLTKNDGDIIPSIGVYTPKASWQGKNTFYDKTNLFEHKPTIITCSFGIQATDNGNGATRCFNWLTKDPENKYIWIRRSGQSEWGPAHESFCEGDGRSEYATEKERKAYDRVMKEYTNNTVIIANKFIQTGFTSGTYEYIAGSKNNDGTPRIENCTDIRRFTVRTNAQVNSGFKFLQTSDQQGFNWSEYRIWESASKCIQEESGGTYQFMVNTGDMTQNGNRIGEWIDYFNGKSEDMNNMEEMATIGNNDLSLNVLYLVGNGDDDNKLWHENITFFYTFELDINNFPEFNGNDGNKYIIPSLYSFNYGNTHFLCVNTEIKKETEQYAYGYNFGTYGVFYPQIKTWCENDYAIHGQNTSWNIAFCHEMPFTILTPSITETTEPVITSRPGSNANTNVPEKSQEYWLSEFFQTHNYPLVFGGHKHTQATSWPILENVVYNDGVRSVTSMHPIIVVSNNPNSQYYIGNYGILTIDNQTPATTLVPYNGYKYPDNWFRDGTLKNEYTNAVQMCTFEWEENIGDSRPVVYAMSQATSYKHTSNKELPGLNIPWLRYYFARKDHGAKKDTAADEQKFPFYTIWNIGAQQIEGNVRKAYGEFNNKGNFDINIDWPYVKNGYSAVEKNNSTKIHSINGITKMDNVAAETDTRTIIIKK